MVSDRDFIGVCDDAFYDIYPVFAIIRVVFLLFVSVPNVMKIVNWKHVKTVVS